MMIGENRRPHPTIQIPSWDQINDPTATISTPFSSGSDYPYSTSPYMESLAPLYRYLPSNEFANESDSSSGDEFPLDSFACDEFRMYEFKVRRCARGRSHDWTECPFAHPAEKARRRDPRKYHYSGTACPEFRKGSCRKGDSCEFAHGVFECWLHPARYRTQPCKDGTSCRRRVCFFAHTPEQLRCEPDLGYSSIRNRFESHLSKSETSTSILISPPISPSSASPPLSPTPGELIASIREMQLSGCRSWGSPMRSGLGLPFTSSLRPKLNKRFNLWENAPREEEPSMEVVESGKELRAKMYARLSKENSLG